MCLVSIFTLSLTLHPVTKRARMWQNLVPNLGFEAKLEMKKLTIWTLNHIWRFASIPMDGAWSCALKNKAIWPVIQLSSHLKRWWKWREQYQQWMSRCLKLSNNSVQPFQTVSCCNWPRRKPWPWWVGYRCSVRTSPSADHTWAVLLLKQVCCQIPRDLQE